jgi:hypothetical protein
MLTVLTQTYRAVIEGIIKHASWASTGGRSWLAARLDGSASDLLRVRRAESELALGQPSERDLGAPVSEELLFRGSVQNLSHI